MPTRPLPIPDEFNPKGLLVYDTASAALWFESMSMDKFDLMRFHDFLSCERYEYTQQDYLDLEEQYDSLHWDHQHLEEAYARLRDERDRALQALKDHGIGADAGLGA